MKNIILILLILSIISCKKLEPENINNNGPIFGTFYDVTYASKKGEDYQKQFDSLFYIINKSMSTYQANSIISKINRNEDSLADHHFVNVFKASKKMYLQTEGVFDPTIGKLVNAWSFGPEGEIVNLDSLKIKSLMEDVGFNKVGQVKDNIRKPEGTFLDFNAIAKGYAVDVVGEITNYMVNIGGELRTKGINIEKEKGWTVGIENPNFDGSQSYDKVFVLKDKAMATSGTYRKFKLDKDGNRYAHIINTKTGYPSKTNILSVSVIADNCMLADGYATAFQATHPELQAYLIFENEKQEFETLVLNNFPIE